jgi:hypothetical protein
MIPHSKIGGDGLPRWEPQNENDRNKIPTDPATQLPGPVQNADPGPI